MVFGEGRFCREQRSHHLQTHMQTALHALNGSDGASCNPLLEVLLPTDVAERMSTLQTETLGERAQTHRARYTLLGREVRGGRSEVSLHQQLMSAAAQPLPRLPRVPVEMVEDTSHYRLVLLGGRERASAHLITHSLIVRYTAKISKIRAKNSATLRKTLCFKKEVKEPWFICDNILA
jgi:hypothetical protein